MHSNVQMLYMLSQHSRTHTVSPPNSYNYMRFIDYAGLFISARLFTETHKRFKISEERVRDHIHTLGLLQQASVEVLREPGDDPYDFKEGDIEYTFSTSKRLKGQGRDPSKRAKVGQDAKFSKCHPYNSEIILMFLSIYQDAIVNSSYLIHIVFAYRWTSWLFIL